MLIIQAIVLAMKALLTDGTVLDEGLFNQPNGPTQTVTRAAHEHIEAVCARAELLANAQLQQSLFVCVLPKVADPHSA